MEEDKVVSIPFVAHESAMNRMERTHDKLVKICKWQLIIIAVMFIGIMIYFLLPSEVVETNTQTAETAENSEVNQTMGD